MNITSIILYLLVMLAIGFSIFGLINRRQSVFSIMAGIMLCLIAVPGAVHAWGESQSIPWTAGYAIAALIGGLAIFRQTKLPK